MERSLSITTVFIPLNNEIEQIEIRREHGQSKTAFVTFKDLSALEIASLLSVDIHCWPGRLCLSRSIGDTNVGEFIIPIPHVKQVKSCRVLPAEFAAKLAVQEALMSRGLKDDTTYLVVDIIPFGLPDLAPTPRKKQNLLYSLVLRKSPNSSKGANKLSAVGVVEELFEEGSSMLSKSKLGKDFPLESNYGLFRCAICQVDQLPGEGLSVNSGPFFSPGSKPWEGPFLCASFRRKKDAMEGKRPMMPAATA